MDVLRRHTLLIILLGSLAMGIVSATGSFGQFAMLPGILALTWWGWQALDASLLLLGSRLC